MKMKNQKSSSKNFQYFTVPKSIRTNCNFHRRENCLFETMWIMTFEISTILYFLLRSSNIAYFENHTIKKVFAFIKTIKSLMPGDNKKVIHT